MKSSLLVYPIPLERLHVFNFEPVFDRVRIQLFQGRARSRDVHGEKPIGVLRIGLDGHFFASFYHVVGSAHEIDEFLRVFFDIQHL